MTAPAVLPAWDIAGVDGFGAQLTDLGYTEDAFLRARRSATHHGRPDLAVLGRRPASTEFDLLFRLLYVGGPIAARDCDRLLGADRIAVLLRSAILRRDADTVIANVRMVPFQGLVLASDREPRHRDAWRDDHVLGVGAASITLAYLTVRRMADAALDLGTGAGIQALLAARHARSVVGTDTSPRALAFARLNAAINGTDSFELREGSFFEPIRNERFGLIVANPPFVISPDRRLTYRDAGQEGDAVSELVVRGVQSSLDEGGFASVLVNWHHDSDDDWRDRPLGWIGPGCDAWLLRLATSSPLDYAADWLRQTDAADPDAYARRLDEWLAYYDSQGIARISAGAVILRRRSSGPNWTRSDTVPEHGLVSDASAQIEQAFHTEDFLRTADPADLLRLRFRPDPSVEIQQQIDPAPDGWEVRSLSARRTVGLSFAGSLDATVLRFLQACDGRRTLSEVIRATSGSEDETHDTRGLDLAASLWRYGIVSADPAVA